MDIKRLWAAGRAMDRQEERGILYSGALYRIESGQKWQISTAYKLLKNIIKIGIYQRLRDVCATPSGKAPPEGLLDPFEH
jgi:hypothetical protein